MIRTTPTRGRRVIEQHRRLDNLVNNAGVTVDRPILSMTVDGRRKVLRVNLSGAYYMSKPARAHEVSSAATSRPARFPQ